jgi:ABC-type multidrug transport system ATPase subunit
MLEKVGMTGRAERKLRGYSKGMRQRIKLRRRYCTIPPPGVGRTNERD